MSAVAHIELSAIRTDGGTQPRASIDTQLVETYAEDMASGAEFPPLVVFFDGVAHWLADGFHRFFAAKGCGLAEFPCDLRQGTVRDAILFSVSANASHGLRRTNEDKRRAVLTLLNDEKWAAWSDREIARHCAVSPHTVASLRPAPIVTVQTHSEPAARTYTTKHGTVATMNTANIGARPVEDRPVFDATPAGRADAPTPQQIQAVRLDWEAGREVATDLRTIFEAMARLPSPTAAADTFPRSLRHTVSADQVRQLAVWLSAFAVAWEQTNGAQNVAA